MKYVFRYELPITDQQEIDLPIGAKIRHLGQRPGDNRNLSIWAEVDGDALTVPVEVLIHGTGHRVTADDSHRFLGTVVTDSGLVWHAYIKDVAWLN